MISELNTVQGSTVSRYLSSSLPFCVRFNVAVTRHAATFDTGPVANSYPDGNRIQLFSNHFQYARAPHCSSDSTIRYHLEEANQCDYSGADVCVRVTETNPPIRQPTIAPVHTNISCEVWSAPKNPPP
jgi:hypothetical protein